MTATTTNTKDKKAGAAAAASSNGDAKWRKIETDLPSFKAELFTERKPGTSDEIYTGPPIEGLVVGLAEFVMQQINERTGEIEERDVTAYLIKLTAPCKGCDRGKDEARDVAIGETLRVIQTAILAQSIPSAVANHPTHMLEVKIVPLKRTKHPKYDDRKIWYYEVFTGGVMARPKGEINAVAQMLASLSVPAALPQGG